MDTGTLPRRYLSISQINSYYICGYKYFYRYFLELPSVPALPLVFGSAGHYALEKALLTVLETKDNEQKLSILYSHFLKYWTKHKDGIPDISDNEERKALNSIMELFDHFITHHSSRLNPQQLEKKVELSVRGVPMLGFVDFIGDVDEVPTVLDYKFTSKEKDQKTADTDIQLTFYSMATEIDRVGFVNFIKPHPYFHPMPSTSVVVAPRTKEDYETFGDEVEKTVEKISNRDFKPAEKGHPLCSKKYCELWEVCPSGKLRGKTKLPMGALKRPADYV